MAAIHASPYAGRWYPADAFELRDLIAEALDLSACRTGHFVRPGGLGFVVPHAAPVYSGKVAAAAYRHIALCSPRRIVLLGFSHRRGVPGVAVPQLETISTPLGTTEIDLEAVGALAGHLPFHTSPEPVLCDHSVEIQLPFLQTIAPQARVLPLYVGHLSEAERKAAAGRLRWLLNDETVLVASSDLTHFGKQFDYLPFPVNGETGSQLESLDGDIISAAASLDADLFFEELHKHRSTVCGYDPVALLLETLNRIGPDETFQETLDYQTSGEITGDYGHSVSYGALGYFPHRSFLLPIDAQRALLEAARQTLTEWQATGERLPIEAQGPPELAQRLGVFVTLYQQGQLQGCIGRCHHPEPLARSVPRLALSAALDDERFEPLHRDQQVEIEISVLSPLKRVRTPSQLIAGVHGGLLQLGARAGLLLPKVATERGWTTAQFVTALTRKAGLPANVLDNPAACLSVFGAQVFKDP